jgi:hypothetical protein
MLIALLIITFIFLGLNVVSFILIRTLLSKIDIYEKWILDFKRDVINTYANMCDIDKQNKFITRVNDKGVFESDDEVGHIFKELLSIIEKLNQRTL